MGIDCLHNLFYDFDTQDWKKWREDVDEAAVMKAVQQHPEDIDGCSFNQAIHLDLGIDVIKALISPITIKEKD
eukprot:10310533-Ditylum_brightwellii.AAC.1